MQEYKAQPLLQRKGGRKNLTIGLQQVIATLLDELKLDSAQLSKLLYGDINSSASKPVEKAVLPNSLP